MNWEDLELAFNAARRPIPMQPFKHWMRFNTFQDYKKYVMSKIKSNTNEVAQAAFPETDFNKKDSVDDGQEGKGLRWVKASERLPEKFKQVIVRSIRTDKLKITENMGHNTGWDVSLDLDFKWDNTEWLDEAALPVADGENKRLISMVERRMNKAGILDILIDNLPNEKYRTLISDFFASLREID